MSGSTSTRILSGKPPRAMWSAAVLLGLYRIRSSLTAWYRLLIAGGMQEGFLVPSPGEAGSAAVSAHARPAGDIEDDAGDPCRIIASEIERCVGDVCRRSETPDRMQCDEIPAAEPRGCAACSARS